jgi:hypothetical protein
MRKTDNPELGWVYYDDNGTRMPWYTLPCLEWLSMLDFKGKDIFEYGLGYSTDWYKSRGAICCGVETHPDWYVESPLNCLTSDPIKYAGKILDFHLFDFVIVDGMIDRDECASIAFDRIKPGGYLICDNWKQEGVAPDWPKTEALTKNLPCKLYVQPDHPQGWTTAVWQKNM